MKLSPPSTHFSIFVSSVLLISLLASCGSPAGSSMDVEDDLGTDEIILPEYFGFVTDPDGLPVPSAIMGGTEFATEDGVVSGEFPEYEGQWIPVESMGYATNYVKSWVSIGGANWFVSRLTPFQWLYRLEDGETIELTASREEDISLTFEISSGQFPESDVAVGLGVINRQDVIQRFLPFGAEEGLRLRHAFAVQAFSADWSYLDLAAGAVIPVRIEVMSPLSDQTAFAYFDPVLGSWVDQDTSCVQEDVLVYLCQLPMTNPLWAIYDLPVEDSTALNDQNPSGLLSFDFLDATQVNLLGLLQDGDGTPQENIKNAMDRLADWMKDHQYDEDGSMEDDPDLQKIIDDLLKNAMDFAAANRTEAGKTILVQVMEALSFVGADNMSMFDEVVKISNEIGENLLKDGGEKDCKKAKKMTKAAEEISLVGGNEQTANQLWAEAKKLAENCDIWEGTIEVLMYTTAQHPADLPLEGWPGGGWSERHNISFWTDIDDFELYSEDNVRHSFPIVRYLEYDPCKAEVSMWGQIGLATIFYEGTYDGITFNIASTDTNGEGTTVKQLWDIYDEVDDTCINIKNQEFAFPHYFSATIHGFGEQAPVRSLQQMLDEGEKSPASDNSEGVDKITGEFEFSNPNPDLGIFPFKNGVIRWWFYHVQKVLPLPEE